jgi:hypothetical protein
VGKEGAENFREYFDNFKKSLLSQNNKRASSEMTAAKEADNLIKDNEIIHLSKSLKSKKISVSDLFGDNE